MLGHNGIKYFVLYSHSLRLRLLFLYTYNYFSPQLLNFLSPLSLDSFISPLHFIYICFFYPTPDSHLSPPPSSFRPLLILMIPSVLLPWYNPCLPSVLTSLHGPHTGRGRTRSARTPTPDTVRRAETWGRRGARARLTHTKRCCRVQVGHANPFYWL